MSSTAWSLLISGAGVLISSLISTFIAGMHTGSVKTDISYMKRDLGEIRQLFTLTLPMAGSSKDKS
jgi:hypothetical protein